MQLLWFDFYFALISYIFFLINDIMDRDYRIESKWQNVQKINQKD